MIMQGKSAKCSNHETKHSENAEEGVLRFRLYRDRECGKLDFTQRKKHVPNQWNSHKRHYVFWRFMANLENSEVIWYDLCKVKWEMTGRHSICKYGIHVLAFPSLLAVKAKDAITSHVLVDSVSSEFVLTPPHPSKSGGIGIEFGTQKTGYHAQLSH